MPSKPRQITLQPKKASEDAAVTYNILEPPPYPYGPNMWYKQSNLGLYGGKAIRAGNNVSHKTKTKTRRTWKPNIVRKNVYSAALDQRIKLRISTRVLRTIDKVGGLDEYLLGEKEARIRELGVAGWSLRWAVMNSVWGRARMGREARKLGLPEEIIAERGWMNKEQFERWQVKLMKEDGRLPKPTEEEVAESSKHAAGQMSQREKEIYKAALETKKKANIAAVWSDKKAVELWDRTRAGIKVIVSRTKTDKQKEIQKVLVLKEATVKHEPLPEAVQEWTEKDNEKLDKHDEFGYDVEAMATLAEEEEVAAEALANAQKAGRPEGSRVST